jgi:hypothetical protein
MNEIRLVLSLEAMQRLADGHELRVRAGDTVIEIVADDVAVNVFQQQVHSALMNLLPVSNTQH